MKKLWMALLLGVVSILLVGCSTYKVTEEDWQIIGTYQIRNTAPELQNAPFQINEEMIVSSHEQLLSRFEYYQSHLSEFNTSQMENIKDGYFNDFFILTFELHLSNKENSYTIDNLYLDNQILHIPVSLYFLADGKSVEKVLFVFMGIKKLAKEQSEKIVLDISSNNSKGSKYYHYK